MNILSIETSCDETAISLIKAHGAFGKDFSYEVLGNALLSQVKIHSQYGGVFPNLAKREHAKNLVPLLAQVIPTISGTTSFDHEMLKTLLEREPELFDALSLYLKEQGKPELDAIAVTHGPGLEPALWVGVNFARALSRVWNIPIVPVNHLEGHIAMGLATTNALKPIEFPALALLISGGHTELDLVEDWPSFKTIGETRDDAVGEAFDKVARMMELPYPGGPAISGLAQQAREQNFEPATKLPRPMLHEQNYDFSFSGLKTAVLRLVKDKSLSEHEKKAMAREFEEAAADVLVGKTLRAVEECGARTVVIGGGVSANTWIRSRLNDELEKIGCEFIAPEPEWSTDNALMIALAGYFRALRNEFIEPADLKANGNLRLGVKV